MLGVIVAGGASKRMGTEKALVMVGDKTMLGHVASALTVVCSHIVIAGQADPIGPWEAVPDEGEAYRGPLAGLVAVARRYPAEPLLLVGVDQPWVQVETLRALGRNLGDLPVVPIDDGFRQPLCAAYTAGLAELGATELHNEGSLQSLLDVTAYQPLNTWGDWGEDGRSWYSADTIEKVNDGIARYGLPTTAN